MEDGRRKKVDWMSGRFIHEKEALYMVLAKKREPNSDRCSRWALN